MRSAARHEARHDPGPVTRPRGLFSTRAAFFVSGQAAATWAPLVPYAKTRLAIDDATLGLVILCLGIGSMATMPLAGWLTGRLGCRAVVSIGLVAMACALPTVALAPSLAALAVAVAVFGAAIGVLDVAMNTQAVLVEDRSGRALMSGIHAFYSLGGAVGAGAMTALLELGVGPVRATLASAALALVLFALSLPDLLPQSGGESARRLARPDRIALLLGTLCMASFLAEGAIADWGALFLQVEHGFASRDGGLAYGVFASAMVVGRLLGDRIVRRLGGVRVVATGGMLAASGYGLAIVAVPADLELAAFALIGLGAANIVPVLISATGRKSSMPGGLAIATVITLGYGGVLLGPAVLGGVAQLSSLSTAFLIVAALLVAVALSARAAA